MKKSVELKFYVMKNYIYLTLYFLKLSSSDFGLGYLQKYAICVVWFKR